jgi:hypothetical protein
VAMMAMLLMMALGAALALTTSSETIIAANFRDSREGRYAADAALERSIADLAAVADWNLPLAGLVQSRFLDGAPGSRALADGSTIDLRRLLNLANCSTDAACTTTEMNRVTAQRPWGANNPRWQLFSYGDLTTLAPGVDSPYYVVVMLGDDASENDNDPTRDGIAPCGASTPVVTRDPPAPSCNPGSGVIALRAEAFGPRGVHKVIEATIARAEVSQLGLEMHSRLRPDAEHLVFETASKSAIFGNPQGYNNGMAQGGVRILSWREVR